MVNVYLLSCLDIQVLPGGIKQTLLGRPDPRGWIYQRSSGKIEVHPLAAFLGSGVSTFQSRTDAKQIEYKKDKSMF